MIAQKMTLLLVVGLILFSQAASATLTCIANDNPIIHNKILDNSVINWLCYNTDFANDSCVSFVRKGTDFLQVNPTLDYDSASNKSTALDNLPRIETFPQRNGLMKVYFRNLDLPDNSMLTYGVFCASNQTFVMNATSHFENFEESFKVVENVVPNYPQIALMIILFLLFAILVGAFVHILHRSR